MSINTIIEKSQARWTLTVPELFSRYRLVRTTGREYISVPTAAFTGPSRPLGSTGYHFQIGVSRRTKQEDMVALRSLAPELPDSGDDRSGVVLLGSDGKPLGGYFFRGADPGRRPWNVVLDKKHRGAGLVVSIGLEWMKATPWVPHSTQQVLNYAAGRLLLKVHQALIEWAVVTGKSVPKRALVSASDDSADVRTLLSKLEAVKPPTG